jgi:hypothetical protein
MIRLTALCLGILLAAGATSLAVAQDDASFSSLEERMSYADFKAAGLDKLTPEELAALNAWLRARGEAAASAPAPAAAAAAPAKQDRRGFSSLDEQHEPIVTRIPGEFTGWQGSGKVIEFENGMAWKVEDPGAKLAVKLTNPLAVIRPGVLNSWFLKVEGYNAQARVIRVR